MLGASWAKSLAATFAWAMPTGAGLGEKDNRGLPSRLLGVQPRSVSNRYGGSELDAAL